MHEQRKRRDFYLVGSRCWFRSMAGEDYSDYMQKGCLMFLEQDDTPSQVFFFLCEHVYSILASFSNLLQQDVGGVWNKTCSHEHSGRSRTYQICCYLRYFGFFPQQGLSLLSQAFMFLFCEDALRPFVNSTSFVLLTNGLNASSQKNLLLKIKVKVLGVLTNPVFSGN